MADRLYFVLLVIFSCFVTIHSLPRRTHNADRSPSRFKRWSELFGPYDDLIVGNRVCIYKDRSYAEGAPVVTDEPCLKCRCHRGSLVCYLRVCPLMPDPPPNHCIVVHRKGACCSELICEDNSILTNHISRAEPSNTDQSSDVVPYGEGCINNGTLYASGSAMTTSSLCQYCYCIGGRQRCLKPRCLLPLDGCTPKYSSLSCCPVQYDCTHAISSTTTTTAPSPFNGCEVDGLIYPEGEKILSVTRSPCDNCYCMRGIVRCVPLTCAPPLLGCIPIISDGKCCASSYDCTKQYASLNSSNQIAPSEGYGVLKEFIINERSFPDDTPLSPSEIADLLRNTAGRFIRRIENKTLSNNETEIPKPNDKELKNTLNLNSKSNVTDTAQKESIDSILFKPFKNSTEKPILNSTTQKSIDLKNTSTLNVTIDSISNELKNNTDIEIKLSEKILNDTVNCTTEINQTDNIEMSSTESTNVYNDTESRIQNLSKNILSEDSSDDELSPVTKSQDDFPEIGSQYPSTSFIIPKDNDIFMVNVSTHVRTNTSSEVTLKPVGQIPPEIEALLNMSLKKNSKDDYMDYDYKSSLPPSLPNLEIIPFLAIDAVLKADEMEAEKQKNSSPYVTSYPILSEDDKYLDDYPTISQNVYNSSYGYNSLPDQYAHTTHSTLFADEDYPIISSVNTNDYNNRQPSVYRQHIGDKFKASTYKPDIPVKHAFAQEKKDEFVDEDETEGYDFLETVKNLFSPPVKTEGGFLPRDPPLIDPYYEVNYPSETDTVLPNSVGVVQKLNKNIGICISNGNEYKNGEFITETDSCMACFCCQGEIKCQAVECSPSKTGYKRILDKNLDPCNIKYTPTSPSSTVLPQVISTFVVPSKVVKMSTTIPTTMKTTTVQSILSTTPRSSSISYDKILTNPPSPTTTPTMTTTTAEPDYNEEEDGEEFSFDSVLKLLLGDDSVETTTARKYSTTYSTTPSTTTTTRMTTTTTPPPTTTSTTTKATPTTLKAVTNTDPITTSPNSTSIPLSAISTTVPNLYKNNYKYSYSKPNRTINTVTLQQKNFTKPIKPTPKPPPTYYSARPNKFKYPSTPAPIPLVTQNFKRINYPTVAPREPIKAQTPNSKRPPFIPTESPGPFGMGLLKLAGCNIYGRMYRVGKIISELSGPCIECMCTDIGVQCKPLSC